MRLWAAVGGARQDEPVARLAELGAARISTGGALAFAAYAALVDAGRELLEQGTYGYWSAAGAGRDATARAFGS